MKPNWDRIDARLAHQMFSWNFDEARFKIFIVRIITNITALFNNIY
jgi:hypothetical protein